MPSPEQIIELLPAYVLDALDEEEKQMVAEYLAACQLCQAELRTYQATFEQLALTVPEATPSPALKDRLMARIQPTLPTTQPIQTRASWRQSLASFLPRLGPVWGIVSLVLIVFLIVSNLLLWQQFSQRAEPVMQVVNLVGTEQAPNAHGVIVITDDGQRGRLVVEGLPPLGPQQQYQLWLVKDDQRDSGVVFPVTEDGFWSGTIESPEPLTNYPHFDVSVEPEGGSTSPTGAPVLNSGS